MIFISKRRNSISLRGNVSDQTACHILFANHTKIRYYSDSLRCAMNGEYKDGNGTYKNSFKVLQRIFRNKLPPLSFLVSENKTRQKSYI
jgi:hypothetical protein